MFWNKGQVYTFGGDKKKQKKSEKVRSEDGNENIPNSQEDSPPKELEETFENTEQQDEPEAMQPKIKEKFNIKKFLKDRRKVGILLICLSLFILVVLTPALNVITAKEMTTAVVSGSDLKKGSKITSDLLMDVTVAKEVLLPIHITDKDMLIGKYLNSDVATGELITVPKISDEIPFDDAYLYNLPEGKRAISITLKSLSSSLSSKLITGDVISIYTRKNTKDDKEQNGILHSELEYIEILAVTNQEAYDLNEAPEKSELDNPIITTVILLSDPAQSKRLVELEGNGEIHATLVIRGNEELKQKYLVQQQENNQKLEQEDKSEQNSSSLG